jgi:putative heme-binding domain-containing protein
VRLALREQLRKPDTWKSIPMQFDKLSNKPQPAIVDVCLGVHNSESAEYLRRTMNATPKYYDQAREFTRYIIRYGDKEPLSWAIAFAQSAGKTDLVHAGNVLQAALQTGQERGIKLTTENRESVEETVKELLSTPTNFKVVQTGVEIAGFAKITKVQPDVLGIVTKAKIPDSLRKAAIISLVEIDAKKAIEPLSTMLLDETGAVAMREQIASALANTNNADAHTALVQALQNSPARLQTTIALGMVGSAQGGERLLQAIETGKASPRLLQDTTIGFRLLKAKVANVQKRVDKLTRGLPAADQKIAELISKKRESFVSFKADVEAGQKIFQKNCGTCHQIAGQGAKIGPQLDGIGARGIERLLEDVLDPNRNVDQSFRTTIISTKQGQTVNGLFLREEGNVIVLADKDGKDVRIDKSSIDERAVSPLSPMPGNFAELVSEAEFHHLMAYLLSQRGKK